MAATVKPFKYQGLLEFERAPDIPWRKVTSDFVSVQKANGHDILTVSPEGLTLLTEEAFKDVAHLLRPEHLQQLANILKDPEASSND